MCIYSFLTIIRVTESIVFYSHLPKLWICICFPEYNRRDLKENLQLISLITATLWEEETKV